MRTDIIPTVTELTRWPMRNSNTWPNRHGEVELIHRRIDDQLYHQFKKIY